MLEGKEGTERVMQRSQRSEVRGREVRPSLRKQGVRATGGGAGSPLLPIINKASITDIAWNNAKPKNSVKESRRSSLVS